MSAPRFCPTCGRPVPLENSFCAWCGTPMTPMAPPSAAAVPPGAPAAPGGTPAPPPAAYPYAMPPPTYVMPRRADAGSMISGTFDTWAKNFGPYFLVYLVLALVTGGLSLVGSYVILGVPYVSSGTFSFTTPSTSNVLAYVGYELLVALVTWVLTSMVLGGVVDFSVRRYRGENVRMMDSLSRGLQRVLSIMGANLLVTLITAGVAILWAVALLLGALSLVSTGTTAGGIAAVCGALVAFPFVLFFVLYVNLALALYAPAVMLEGQHAVDSLGRSWNLMRGHKWSLLGAGIVIGIVLLLIDGALGLVGGIGSNDIVLLVADSIGAALTGAWFAILTSVAYDLITKLPQPSVWPPTYAPPPAMPPR